MPAFSGASAPSGSCLRRNTPIPWEWPPTTGSTKATIIYNTQRIVYDLPVSSPLPALDGVRILDFSTVGPGSRCTRILADYGATVVKVGVPPKKARLQTQPAYWAYSANRGLRQVRLDLKDDGAKAAFLRLAATADVILESFRPGVVDRLGVGWGDIRKVNPRIIYCSTSGYGQTGPSASWAGHDINYLAVGGYLACSEPGPGGKPPIPGATIADSTAGGMHAALAIMAALMRREKSGEGEFLDVSVADGVLTLMSLYIDQHLATGAEPGPRHDVLTGRYAYYDTYACADGKWVAVGAIEPQFYANLCNALGCEQWLAHQNDDSVQEQVRADFAAAFERQTRDEWAAELASADTCLSPVYEIRELAQDPQYRARGAFSDARHEAEGIFQQLAPVLAGQDRAEGPIAAGDSSKSDTEVLLRDAGLGTDEIDRLRERGAIA
ncbi:MAG: CoA transferase [bacterium]|nr:CoA transferase [bacterium]